MVGILTKADSALTVVRGLAETSAQRRGQTLFGRGLRLFVDADERTPSDGGLEVDLDVDPASPFALGRAYELLLAPATRRKAGAHLTPEAVARNIVGLVPEVNTNARVLDPTVGGGAFLLAAADRLVAEGSDPSAVINQLHGLDLDSGAVAVAEAALALWALDNGVSPGPLPQLVCGDALFVDLPLVDLVVGNPPFLNQLRSSSTHSAKRRAALRDRWGALVGAYTDVAWLFLAAGFEALDLGGSLALVQPVSILAARHAGPVREHVLAHGDLTGLWVGRDQVFDAAVQVCAVVAERSQSTSQGNDAPKTRLWAGMDFEELPATDQPGGARWGAVASVALAVPYVRLDGRRTVGDLASATAGFRDQFYGLVPVVSDRGRDHDLDTDVDVDVDVASGSPRLVTVGMIDPFQLGWGTRAYKFAKRSFTHPVVDVAGLDHDDPKLAEWVHARLRPKILMATQTRVVEVWVDASGTAVPTTPVLSIEPHDPHNIDELWLLAAALGSPALSAFFVAKNFGTALSLDAMKLAARDVLEAPLPTHPEAWTAAAEIVQVIHHARPGEIDRELFAAFASLMSQAYGTKDEDATSWWLDRVPDRSFL